MKGFIFGLSIGGISGVVLGVIIGIAMFAGAGYLMQGGTNIPYDQNHISIADRIVITDLTDGVQLTHKLLWMGSAKFHPYIKLDLFTPTKSYTESCWAFCCENDIDVTVLIWGAGNDGHSYKLEFGRHMGNSAEIKAFNQTIVWPKDSSIGYTGFDVYLP